jgi:hypothetical protein
VKTDLARQPESNLSNLDTDTLLKLATGNTKGLSQAQKVELIVQVCKVAGLDPRLSPFEYITFQGKEVLYARKNAADQLVNVHKIKVGILSQEIVEGIRVVTVAATTADGREQQDIGAVPIKGLQGDALANAMMKAVTKAKRRTVLSVCGLSMLDESELETIPAARAALSHVGGVSVESSPSPRAALASAAAPEPDTGGILSPGEDPPAMEPEVVEPLASETDKVLLAIAKAQTRGALLVLVPRIKALPSEDIATVRAAYAARKGELP